MRIEIDIDPSDLLDGDDVFEQVATDAFDMLKSGRAETARAILAEFLGRHDESAVADPEFARVKKLEKLFTEWQEIPLKDRPDFWSWSHGKRLCS